MIERFKVSAAWMQTCGLGTEAKVFDVIRLEPNLSANPFFACMVIVRRDGREWTVAIGRGEFVAPEAPTPNAPPALPEPKPLHKPRPYYLLCTHEGLPLDTWAPQFGAYEPADVEAERDEYKESGIWPKGTRFKIITFTSTGLQSEADAAVARLNGIG